MKNKLYIFGCSYSALFQNSGIKNEYLELLKKWPRHWSEMLAEKLDLELKNYALGGSGNDSIFDLFCSKSHLFQQGDVIIIGWTYMNRFRVFDTTTNETWENLSIGTTTESSSKIVSNQTIEEICVNRTSPAYEVELHNRENLIKTFTESKNLNLFLWNAGYAINNQDGYLLEYLKKDSPTDTFVDIVKRHGGLNIEEETNGKVLDNHFGKIGNEVQADLFYKEIKDKLIV